MRGSIFRINTFLSLVLVVFSFASCSGQSKLLSLTTSQPAAPAPVASADVAGVQGSYADLVARVSPAVVTIRSTERARASQQYPFMDDPTLRELFGDRLPQQPQMPRQVQGVGSGVIISSDGYILTNLHVFYGAL